MEKKNVIILVSVIVLVALLILGLSSFFGSTGAVAGGIQKLPTMVGGC